MKNIITNKQEVLLDQMEDEGKNPLELMDKYCDMWIQNVYTRIFDEVFLKAKAGGNNRVIITDEIKAKMQEEISKANSNAVVETNSRIIFHDDWMIIIYVKHYDLYFYTEYTPEMYLALADTRMFTYQVSKDKNGKYRLKTQLKLPEQRKRRSTYFYKFIYDLDQSGMNIREYITATQLYKKELTIPSDMTVDHADNNVSNNCTWNLSLMTRGENGEKGNLFSDIRYPYYCYNAVGRDGGYRTVIGKLGTIDEGRWEQIYYSENPYDLIGLLRWVTDLVKKDTDCIDTSGYLAEDIYFSYCIAKKLLEIPKENFVRVVDERTVDLTEDI